MAEQRDETGGGASSARGAVRGSGRRFEVVSPFSPAGDQPRAIAGLVDSLGAGEKFSTLLGVTGSGKSATVGWMIEAVQRPALVIAPNKSLAAQLAAELSEMFPHNAVEYFVSYYDYYQPEAYVPSSDTFIEKDSSINDEIERLRHSATAALLSRRDVIVVASVSCIYGLGSPEEYAKSFVSVRVGDVVDSRELCARLVAMGYERNDVAFERGRFRVRGDTIEILGAGAEEVVRIELFGDDVEALWSVDPVSGEKLSALEEAVVFSATHYATDPERLGEGLERIEAELEARLAELRGSGKLLEAQRLEMRTRNDIEMLQEVGTCAGVENYSAPLEGRGRGEPPSTLLEYFDEDFVCIIDESHVAIPQLFGQHAGDASRKATLVEHGFRLPSAADNRPLRFEEFVERVGQVVFLSATPGSWELEHSTRVVEQVIRPTGLVDPPVEVAPSTGQVADVLVRIREVVERGERALVCTLTKRMAEQLSEYLSEEGVRVRYLHSDVTTPERIELVRGLRLGEFDVLVGINLLREGLDIPEVALMAILDADKEGFLRSESSLVQMIGRAARNANGKVVMYADSPTGSMERALAETDRRRAIQVAHNEAHGIVPTSVTKSVSDVLEKLRGSAGRGTGEVVSDTAVEGDDLAALVASLEAEMATAAAELRFEEAAALRDELRQLRADLREAR